MFDFPSLNDITANHHAISAYALENQTLFGDRQLIRKIVRFEYKPENTLFEMAGVTFNAVLSPGTILDCKPNPPLSKPNQTVSVLFAGQRAKEFQEGDIPRHFQHLEKNYPRHENPNTILVERILVDGYFQKHYERLPNGQSSSVMNFFAARWQFYVNRTTIIEGSLPF